MITDEEAKKAAEILQEYCKKKKCNSCYFERSGIECVLDYYIPSDWKLEENK